MRGARLAIWLIVLAFAVAFSIGLMPNPDTYFSNFTSHVYTEYPEPFGFDSTYIIQNFDELYKLGLLMNVTFERGHLWISSKGKPFKDVVIQLLKTDAWNATPQQYANFVSLAGYFTLNGLNDYTKYYLGYKNNTIALALVKLNYSIPKIPYPPTADIIFYNYSWVEQYTLVVGDGELNYTQSGNLLIVTLHPCLLITNDGVHVRKVYFKPYTKAINLTRGGVFDYVGEYYEGYGPLYHVHFEVKNYAIENFYVERRYLYFEKWNFTFYPLVKVYNGSKPIFVNVSVDGVTKSYEVKCQHGLCYTYAPFSIEVDSPKVVPVTINLTDFIHVGNLTVKREVRVATLKLKFVREGNLPGWNGNSFIHMRMVPEVWRVRHHPPWIRGPMKPNASALCQYLLVIESMWINSKFDTSFERYWFDNQILLSISSMPFEPKCISEDALKCLLWREGNKSSLNYLGYVLLSTGNYVHVDRGVIRNFDFEPLNGYVMYVYLDNVSKDYLTLPHIELDKGYTFIDSPVMQKTATGLWVWVNDRGKIEPLIEPLHEPGDSLVFVKGVNLSFVEADFGAIKRSIKKFNVTYARNMLLNATNSDEFKIYLKI